MADSPAIASPEEGTLDRVPVAQLLAEAWRDRRSGTLRISRGKTQRCIDIQDGSPIAVESDSDQDGFALMLESAGLINTADRIKVESMARSRERPQASAVLALRLLDAKELYKALRQATRLQLAETLEWQTGEYCWVPAADAIESKGKPHDVLKLLQDQLPMRWGSERLFQALMPQMESCGDISPRFRRVATKLAETHETARLAIERLDGTLSLGQVLGQAAGDPIAAATLWTLLHAGVLRIGERREIRPALDSVIEIEVEVSGSAGAGRTRNGSDAGAARSSAEKSGNPKAEALRLEIADLLDGLSDLDHYDALGLTSEATTNEIKKAYFRAAKKFHPDTLARLELNDLRDTAARVFARIAEAFETLSDADKRKAYDAGGSDEPEIDTARLAQAETSYRKGEILVRMGNFHGALEYLEPAVEFWPEEAAYQSLLGWALYKQPTPNTERAREHLEMARSQAPGDAIILFRLGVVLRAQGETDQASALIEQARSIEPSVDE